MESPEIVEILMEDESNEELEELSNRLKAGRMLLLLLLPLPPFR
jgi:hypothetical protein